VIGHHTRYKSPHRVQLHISHSVHRTVSVLPLHLEHCSLSTVFEIHRSPKSIPCCSFMTSDHPPRTVQRVERPPFTVQRCSCSSRTACIVQCSHSLLCSALPLCSSSLFHPCCSLVTCDRQPRTVQRVELLSFRRAFLMHRSGALAHLSLAFAQTLRRGVGCFLNQAKAATKFSSRFWTPFLPLVPKMEIFEFKHCAFIKGKS